MPQDEKLNWSNVDMATLPKPLQKAYQDLKLAQQVAASKRDAFEEAANVVLQKANKVPQGKEPVWSYRFGKLGLAFRPVQPKRDKKPGGGIFQF